MAMRVVMMAMSRRMDGATSDAGLSKNRAIHVQAAASAIGKPLRPQHERSISLLPHRRVGAAIDARIAVYHKMHGLSNVPSQLPFV